MIIELFKKNDYKIIFKNNNKICYIFSYSYSGINFTALNLFGIFLLQLTTTRVG